MSYTYVNRNFSILAIFTNFCPIKIDLSGNTVWRKLQVFKNSSKLTIFGIYNQLLATQNVNVARFARNVDWDFFCDFQTPCTYVTYTVVDLVNVIEGYAVLSRVDMTRCCNIAHIFECDAK